MAGKLALVVILMHSIPILALPTYEVPITSKSLTSPHNKRYYFPETLPDEDELKAIKETVMREAGFVTSSNPYPESGPMHKMETELRKAHPNPDAAIDTAAPAKPARYTQDTELKHSQFRSRLEESETFGSDEYEYPIYWPPFGFFVVSAAIVCLVTILKGIRAK
ncbi:uncharacterized protein N7500_007256 [Penicillium coprophilum]|uniref:uncharacterized protein n=1 Tax=Penicillium coprophilum TaxID=36646 RepID=UPI002390D160|nr:uncharacterized protein N7500_007256 [Penicillium coprophilum]KAJ5165426.1 hypothetical protein N7500_007256 [Penicillium coprophilum]